MNKKELEVIIDALVSADEKVNHALDERSELRYKIVRTLVENQMVEALDINISRLKRMIR